MFRRSNRPTPPLKRFRILDTQREAIRCGRPQPFMLLLPAWTSKWLPWRTFLWALARMRSGRLEVRGGGE